MSKKIGIFLAIVSGAVLVTAAVLQATSLQRENADLRNRNVELSKVKSAMDIRLVEMEGLVESKERTHAASLQTVSKERERMMDEVKKEKEDKVSEITKELEATVKSLQLVKSQKEQTEAELASVSGDLVEAEQRCKSEGDASREKLEEMIANFAREKADLVENAKSEKEGATREKDSEIANVRQTVTEREAELENVKRQVLEKSTEISELIKEKEGMLAKKSTEISELIKEKEEMLVKVNQLQFQLDTNSKDLTLAVQKKDETLTQLDSKTKDLKVALKEKEELTMQLGASGVALEKEKQENEERVKRLQAAKAKAEDESRAAQGDLGNCLVERSTEAKEALEERSRVYDECKVESRKEAEKREKVLVLEKEAALKELDVAKGRLASCNTES